MWLSRTGSRRAKGRRPSEGSLPELQVSSSFSSNHGSMENGPLGDDQLIFSGNIFDWSMITGGSVWVVRGTVGIHGATHGGMNSKQNQLEIFWVFGPRFFRSSKILNRNAGNAERFIRNVGWIFGTWTMCLGFVFSWPVGWHVLCSGGIPV